MQKVGDKRSAANSELSKVIHDDAFTATIDDIPIANEIKISSSVTNNNDLKDATSLPVVSSGGNDSAAAAVVEVEVEVSKPVKRQRRNAIRPNSIEVAQIRSVAVNFLTEIIVSDITAMHVQDGESAQTVTESTTMPPAPPQLQ
jgi:hypothetical protein